MALPFEPMICASPETLPSASATLGWVLTVWRSDSCSGGAVAPLPSLRLKADFPLMTTLEPCRESVKMLSNAFWIESVSTRVPATSATPRTIATAVSTVRSFRPSRPLSATRVIAG